MEIQVYEDKVGEWRWRVVSPNGRKLADSAEGYTNKEDMMDALNILWPIRTVTLTGD